jgi:Trypsin
LFLSGTNIVAGLTSYGVGCAEPNYSGVYTRVSTYDTWIRGTICRITDVPTEALDCDGLCGDGTCAAGYEDCDSCPADCTTCPPKDDGVCGVGESCRNSPADCGPCSVVSATCPAGITATGLGLNGIGTSITYKLTVPAGDAVRCTLSGGTGDADLSILLGDFYCEADDNGNTGSCFLPNVAATATKATIQVIVFTPYSGVALSCTCSDFVPKCGDGFCTNDETCESCSQDCGECPPTCADGINESGLDTAIGDEGLFFTIEVTSGKAVECETTGGSGDLAMVMVGVDDAFVDCENDFEGTEHSCATEIAAQDGTVLVALFGIDSFSGVTLSCSCTGIEPPTGPPARPPSQQPGFFFTIPILGPILQLLYNILFFWA